MYAGDLRGRDGLRSQPIIPRAVRNGVFDPQPKAQAFALMASNLQTPAPSAAGQTKPHFHPRDA